LPQFKRASCLIAVHLVALLVGRDVQAVPTWTWLHAKYGERLFDEVGIAVAGVGDIDGDSHADFIVGIRRGPLALGGKAIVYSGRTGNTIFTLSTADSADGFGNSVAGLGDVDGDGIPDFVVGAPTAMVPGIGRAGAVFCYSGASGGIIYLLNTGPVIGNPGDWFGWSVAGSGDMDQDGRADILIGAPFADNAGFPRSGSAFLFSGATGSILRRVDGSTGDESFGWSVDDAGDLDSDGVPDFLVGSSGSTVGVAVVVSGSTGQEIRRITNMYTVIVSGSPDLNGDAVPDFIVGVPLLASAPGSATVYSGATGDTLRAHVGQNAAGRFGASVDGGGDLNGDSVPDILVGAPLAYVGAAGFEGSAYAYSGIKDSVLFHVDGISRDEKFGYSVAFAGDVNGDGRDDLIIGAPYARTRRSQIITGAALVFGLVDVVQARGFLSSGGTSASLGAGQRQICFQLEPVAGSFDPAEVVTATLVLRREGIDYVEEPAQLAASGQITDADGNGLQEITACFSREDLRDLLFDLPPGQDQVTVSLEANTAAGLRPRATVALELAVPGVKTATLAPNPMPGSGVVSFVTSKPGLVKVDLFDGLGRHVRQVLRDPNAPAGPQDVVIDGRDKSGRKLASGVYYFKFTSPDGVFSGRAVILR